MHLVMEPAVDTATDSAPHPRIPGRAYEQLIDSHRSNGDHHGRHKSSSHLSDFLKPSEGKKKKAEVPRLPRGKGSNGSADGASMDATESRPFVLERRKKPDLPADAKNQVREFQALARNLLDLREQDHQVISRELHDNIAQILSATAARITLAREEAIPAWLRQELLDLGQQLQLALTDVRHLARDLRPSFLDPHGFAAALNKHAEAFRERTTITLEVRLDPQAVSFFETDNLTHLFRLAQEALHNIEDHSGACNAWIILSEHDKSMLLEIGDDGCAFTPERVVKAQRDGHLGLLGMRERAELLGGQFIIEAEPGQGTVIRITIPPQIPPPEKPLNQDYEANHRPHC
jgi:signal transduction histidine kinase